MSTKDVGDSHTESRTTTATSILIAMTEPLVIEMLPSLLCGELKVVDIAYARVDGSDVHTFQDGISKHETRWLW
jgi:hypothetical protein